MRPKFMKTKVFLVLAGIVVAMIGAAFFFGGGSLKPSPIGDSTGLIVDNNAIYVVEQVPSRTVLVAVVRFAKPGFVAIHENNAGQPGKILGASGVLPAGETKNLTPIMLSRATADGETLYAMLYDDNGDGAFDAAKDKPLLDSESGQPVMMIFSISVGASEPGAVNL